MASNVDSNIIEIVTIGTAHGDRQRNTPGVDYKVPLRAQFAMVGWVRAGFLAPRGLATLAPSTLARPQSI